MIISPCISKCNLDPSKQYCAGCKRTTQEIAEWRRYTYDQRFAIMQELDKRLFGPNGEMQS